MVKAEETLQAIRVLLGGLQSIDVFDLPIEEALVPSSEVDDELTDSFLDHALLLVGDSYCTVLKAVQRCAEFGQLGLTTDRKRFELGHRDARVRQRFDELGQPNVGQLPGGIRYFVDRLEDSTPDNEDHAHAQEHAGDGDKTKCKCVGFELICRGIA